MFVVWAPNSVFGLGVTRNAGNVDACDSGGLINCLWNTYSVSGFAPTQNQMWMLATVDGNGDGIMGIPMIDGPFAGFNAGFNANFQAMPDFCDLTCYQLIPLPTAAWLFGSGMLGLIGVARHRYKFGSC